MSEIRYRLVKLLPSLVAEAQKEKDPEIKSRFYLIKAVVSSRKSVKSVCDSRGESTDTFYKWAKRLLKNKSLSGLKSHSRKPKKSPNQTPKRVEKRILKLRRVEPYNGPDVISHDLKLLFNIKCPPSTVYNVLKREGMIKEEYRKSLTKKHMKRYRRPIPGFLQMDFKYVPYFIEDRQYYQLSCVDHHSSWRLIRCYPHKDLNAVRDFLKELEIHCPFPIIQIQTDNDKAFTDKYRIDTDGIPTGNHVLDRWCAKRSVEHRLIPIGQKELNGKVENTHKWDDREFFSQIYPKSLAGIQLATLSYNDRWNALRRRKTQGWKTPNEVVERSYVACITWLQAIMPPPVADNYVREGINPEGHYELRITPPKPGKKKNPKRKTAIDRYLQWMEWDQKKSSFAIAPLPLISQISSQSSMNYLDLCRAS